MDEKPNTENPTNPDENSDEIDIKEHVVSVIDPDEYNDTQNMDKKMQ